MITRKFIVLVVVGALGLVAGAIAVRELRGPQRTIVDPIELDFDDPKGPGRERVDGRRKSKRSERPDATRPSTPREQGAGANPAPAPPVRAGDDDVDDDESESDDEDGDD